MKNKIFNKAFWFGFAIVVLSFVIFNLMTLTIGSETRLYNRVNDIGFPFAFYEWGGNPYAERILPFGLLANVVIMLTNAVLAGFLFNFMWKSESNRIVN